MNASNDTGTESLNDYKDQVSSGLGEDAMLKEECQKKPFLFKSGSSAFCTADEDRRTSRHDCNGRAGGSRMLASGYRKALESKWCRCHPSGCYYIQFTRWRSQRYRYDESPRK